MKLIKHKSNTEVAFLVLRTIQVNDIYKIKGRWINIVNRNNIYDMDSPDRIEIKQNDYINDWHQIEVYKVLEKDEGIRQSEDNGGDTPPESLPEL